MAPDVGQDRLSVAILTPLSTGTSIRQDRAYLVEFRGGESRLEADFRSTLIGDAILRVSCDGIIQLRLTDETEYSISSEPLEGINPSGFAYVVENGRMYGQLSEAAQIAHRNRLKHYLVVSLSDCLELISSNPPQFKLVQT
jgi:hypothetical protein